MTPHAVASSEVRDPAATPLHALPGVGPVRSARLLRLGLTSVRDLLLFAPRRLEAPARAGAIEDSKTIGERVRVRGTVKSTRFHRGGRRRSVLRVRIEDDTGAIDLLFFNQPWLRKRFGAGEEVACEGRVVDAGGAAIAAPRLVLPDETSTAPLPVYPLTEGIGQGFLRGIAQLACDRHADDLGEPLTGEHAERLAALGLPPLPQAIRSVHVPVDEASFEVGRRRLGLERLLVLQARLVRDAVRVASRATRIEIATEKLDELMGRFPAPFTGAQCRAALEIARDLAQSRPMRRLLQGDVGSGKTWVGVLACLVAARGGRQAAFMAPTELLAEQHFLGLRSLFDELGLRSVLLTGSLPSASRRRVLDELASGAADVAFGTHALFSREVRFARLALAIVDEQHRFGVGQRRRFFAKGRDVHVLLMTATPIPRTLALTVYGDLEITVLDELPPGRGGVSTRRVPREKVPDMRRFLLECARRGERVFWVSPRIEGDDGAERAHRVWREELAGVELVHGRLPATVRAERLERFRSGDSPVLVATTVVEVGVDVPEATAIAIDGAHRLGLAQLHQLRGRVGRGPKPSWCFLVGDDVADDRFAALERTADGFELAEADLAQRGMGSLGGLRQAGINDEGLEGVALDVRLVELARRAVREDEGVRERYCRYSEGAG